MYHITDSGATLNILMITSTGCNEGHCHYNLLHCQHLQTEQNTKCPFSIVKMILFQQIKTLQWRDSQCNDFSFLLVPVVGVISTISTTIDTTIDRELRNIAVTSVVVTSIVSSMISLVGIEPIAIARIVVLVLVSISSSNWGETKSKMLWLEMSVKKPVKIIRLKLPGRLRCCCFCCWWWCSPGIPPPYTGRRWETSLFWSLWKTDALLPSL